MSCLLHKSNNKCYEPEINFKSNFLESKVLQEHERTAIGEEIVRQCNQLFTSKNMAESGMDLATLQFDIVNYIQKFGLPVVDAIKFAMGINNSAKDDDMKSKKKSGHRLNRRLPRVDESGIHFVPKEGGQPEEREISKMNDRNIDKTALKASLLDGIKMAKKGAQPSEEEIRFASVIASVADDAKNKSVVISDKPTEQLEQLMQRSNRNMYEQLTEQVVEQKQAIEKIQEELTNPDTLQKMVEKNVGSKSNQLDSNSGMPNGDDGGLLDGSLGESAIQLNCAQKIADLERDLLQAQQEKQAIEKDMKDNYTLNSAIPGLPTNATTLTTERDDAIVARDAAIVARDAAIVARDAAIVARDAAITEKTTLEGENTVKDQNIASLTTEKDDAVRENTVKDQKIASLTVEKDDAVREKDDAVRTQHTAIANATASKDAEIASLTAEKNDAIAEKTRLEGENTSLTANIALLQGQISSLTAEKNDAEQDKNTLMQQNANLERDVTRLESENNALTAAKTQLNECIQKLKQYDSSVDDANYEQALLDVIAKAKQHDITISNSSAPNLTQDIAILRAEILQKESQLQSLQGDIAIVRASLATSERNLLSANTSIASLASDNANLNGKVNFLKQFEQKSQTLEAEKSALETKVQNLETEKSALETKVQNLETEKSALETRVRDLETEKSALETKVRDLETEKSALETRVQDLEQQVNDQNLEITRLNGEINSNDVSQLRSTLGQSELQNRKLQEKIDLLDTKITTLTNEKNAAESENRRLGSENGAFRNQNSTLTNTNNTLQSKLYDQNLLIENINGAIDAMSTAIRNINLTGSNDIIRYCDDLVAAFTAFEQSMQVVSSTNAQDRLINQMEQSQFDQSARYSQYNISEKKANFWKKYGDVLMVKGPTNASNSNRQSEIEMEFAQVNNKTSQNTKNSKQSGNTTTQNTKNSKQSNNTTTQNTKNSKQGGNNSVGSKVKDTSSKLALVTESIKTKITDLKNIVEQHINLLNIEIDDLKNQNADLQTENNRLSATAPTAASTAVSTTVSALQGDINLLRTQNGTLNTKISQLRNENQALQIQTRDAILEKERFEIENRNLSLQLTIAQTSASALASASSVAAPTQTNGGNNVQTPVDPDVLAIRSEIKLQLEAIQNDNIDEFFEKMDNIDTALSSSPSSPQNVSQNAPTEKEIYQMILNSVSSLKSRMTLLLKFNISEKDTQSNKESIERTNNDPLIEKKIGFAVVYMSTLLRMYLQYKADAFNSKQEAESLKTNINYFMQHLEINQSNTIYDIVENFNSFGSNNVNIDFSKLVGKLRETIQTLKSQLFNDLTQFVNAASIGSTFQDKINMIKDEFSKKNEKIDDLNAIIQTFNGARDNDIAAVDEAISKLTEIINKDITEDPDEPIKELLVTTTNEIAKKMIGLLQYFVQKYNIILSELAQHIDPNAVITRPQRTDTMNDLITDNNDLKRTNEILQRQIADSMRELATSESEKTTLEEMKNALESSVVEINGENQALNLSMTRLTSEKQLVDAQCADLQREKNDLNDKISLLEYQIATTQSLSLTSENEEITRLRTKAFDIKKNYNSLLGALYAICEIPKPLLGFSNSTPTISNSNVINQILQTFETEMKKHEIINDKNDQDENNVAGLKKSGKNSNNKTTNTPKMNGETVATVLIKLVNENNNYQLLLLPKNQLGTSFSEKKYAENRVIMANTFGNNNNEYILNLASIYQKIVDLGLVLSETIDPETILPSLQDLFNTSLAADKTKSKINKFFLKLTKDLSSAKVNAKFVEDNTEFIANFEPFFNSNKSKFSAIGEELKKSPNDLDKMVGEYILDVDKTFKEEIAELQRQCPNATNNNTTANATNNNTTGWISWFRPSKQTRISNHIKTIEPPIYPNLDRLYLFSNQMY